MSKHYFFYDESEHSRKISYKTVSALNYYDNFIAMIVGWNDSKDDILQRYLVFETAYTDRKDRNGEIKSTMLSQKQFQYGFASLNKQNAQFVSDFLSLFDETNHVYFSVSSKIEYLVSQLFQGYNNNLLVDADLMKYSITKTLVIYRPQEIIRCLYESPERFIEELKTFFQNRIDINKNHSDLKQAESKAFQDILLILEDISDPPVLDWDYHMPFDGFTKYLKEKNIHDYVLIIDKEGDPEKESKTLNTARSIGLENSYEADSTKYPGLRISDMLAGIISKLLKGLCDSLRYQSVEDGINKKVLDPKWFNLNEVQLNLYKKLYRLICEWQPAWYKSYAGIYSDDLVVFNALLNYMNHFESAKQIQSNITMQGEYFNAFACEQLARYFEVRKCKLPIEPVALFDQESFINDRGAKVFIESKKQPFLQLTEGSQVFEVLSVGVDQRLTPTATILKNGNPECFQLPAELSEWVTNMVGFAAMGMNLFPAKVVFTYLNGKYYADIL